MSKTFCYYKYIYDFYKLIFLIKINLLKRTKKLNKKFKKNIILIEIF